MESYNDLIQNFGVWVFAGMGFGAFLGIFCLATCKVINIFEKSIN